MIFLKMLTSLVAELHPLLVEWRGYEFLNRGYTRGLMQYHLGLGGGLSANRCQDGLQTTAALSGSRCPA